MALGRYVWLPVNFIVAGSKIIGVNQLFSMFFTQRSQTFTVSDMEYKVTIENLLHGKRLFAATIFASLCFLASPASAACVSGATVVCDKTQIEAYSGSSFQSTYSANGFVNGVGDVLQSAGEPFNTDKLIANLTTNRGVTTLELQYYTSFDGNEDGANYADIFLGSNASSAHTYSYAISLGDETANGGLAAGFYENVTPSTEKISEQIWDNKAGTYGGKYLASDGNWYYSPTVVTTGAKKDTAFTTTISETTTTADPGFGYLVDVKLTASATDFNALFGSGLSVFWGTADCSNDAIQAILDPTPTRVPEPLTASLFCAGLGGAALMRRRRKSKVS